MDKLPPEYVARINRSFESHQRSQSRSSDAKVSFHEKLAVLTAGSLAIVVSGTGALHQKPLSPFATRLLFISLATSAVLLWFSLVASILHNFLESYALACDAEVGLAESSLYLIRGLAELDIIKEQFSPLQAAAEPIFAEYQKHHNERAWRLRGWEVPLSIASVSLFVLGYLSVVGYVIVLASKH